MDNAAADLRRPGHPHRRERPRPADRPGPLRPGAPRAPAARQFSVLPRRATPRWRAPPTTAATGSSSSCRAPASGSWFLTPDHLFFMGAAVLLCYWLALHLTSPVRALQKAVERFGRGDLTARVEFHAPRRAGPAGPHLRPHGRPHRNPAGRRAPPAARYFPRAALAAGAPGRGRGAGALRRRPGMPRSTASRRNPTA